MEQESSEVRAGLSVSTRTVLRHSSIHIVDAIELKAASFDQLEPKRIMDLAIQADSAASHGRYSKSKVELV
jgi:hypothetical protein